MPQGATTLPGGPEEPASIDVSAAQCFLQALRDGTPSSTQLVFRESFNASASATVWVLGDGTAIEAERHWGDTVTLDYVPRRYELKPREFFDECLASEDAETLVNCVLSWPLDREACLREPQLPCPAD